MPMGVTLARAGLARKMALENECHTCRIYLMLAGTQGGGWANTISYKA